MSAPERRRRRRGVMAAMVLLGASRGGGWEAAAAAAAAFSSSRWTAPAVFPPPSRFVVPSSARVRGRIRRRGADDVGVGAGGSAGVGGTTSGSTASGATALFGIKGFRSWYESQFPNAMTPLSHPPDPSSASSSSDDSSSQSETFDHVLIDVNQLLHVALRRSRTEGHALTLAIKELDRCTSLAKPTRSVVLAFDGPPSAAKLATQRRRRFGTVVRAEVRRERLDFFLMRRGVVSGMSIFDDDDEGGGVGFVGDSSSRRRRRLRLDDDDPERRLLSALTPAQRRERKRRRERYSRDESTLCITPGTTFMDRAHGAFLYWAWQRLSNPSHPLSSTRIYLSPSTVPGEGEVKLLDWILRSGGGGGGGKGSGGGIVRPGHSIAIMGGDSDLVLEGLVIPPSITHNVFVILPEGSRRSYAVSLWETTRTLSKFLPDLDGLDMMRLRHDLVLLLIMNGNDYLPKLRGSSGFNKLFHSYLRLLKDWLREEKRRRDDDDDGKDPNPEHAAHGRGTDRPRPFLVDPDSVRFNLPFCVAFFRRLARSAPDLAPVGGGGSSSSSEGDDPAEDDVATTTTTPAAASSDVNGGVTPLSYLNTIADAGFLPKPIRWDVVRAASAEGGDEKNGDGGRSRAPSCESSDASSKREEDGGGKEEEEEDGTKETLRLTLGSSPPSRYVFEVPHKRGRPTKSARQRLANIALEELLGEDYLDLNDLASGVNDAFLNAGREEEDGDKDGDEEDEGSDDDDASSSSSAGIGYSWEIPYPAPCQVDTYLGGLLWNLQTYQDGVCSDYGYNYGRRSSPTAGEIVSYLKDAMANGRVLGREELLGDRFTPPIDAGLSCLAALPSQVNHLVPEPYVMLSANGAVEDIYASCMDPNDNVFDMSKFERVCKDRIAEMKRTTTTRRSPEEEEDDDDANGGAVDDDGGGAQSDEREPPSPGGRKGRRILTGDHFWTVLSKSRAPLAHPFAPPEPFSERMSTLRPNRRMKASRIYATTEPRRRRESKERRGAGNTEGAGRVKPKGSLTHRKIEQDRKRGRRDLDGSDDDDEVAIKHSDMRQLLVNPLGEQLAIEGVGYKRAYLGAKEMAERKRKETTKQRRAKIGASTPPEEEGLSAVVVGGGDDGKRHRRHRKKHRIQEQRMKDFRLVPPPSEPDRNVEGRTAAQCLQQLMDGRYVGRIEWDWTSPSPSDYAAFSPEEHEHVRLTVRAPAPAAASESSGAAGGRRNRTEDRSASSSDLVYEQDRNVNFTSRQILKQHLASLALCDLMGPQRRWTEMKYVEMKGVLKEGKASTQQ